MSEVFRAFAEVMQAKSKAALSYHLQVNGQQERCVRTMIQTVPVYVEDYYKRIEPKLRKN